MPIPRLNRSRCVMNHFELRLTNYNYDALTFEKRIRHLLERDEHLLGAIVQRTCIARNAAGSFEHVITRMDVLSKHDQPFVPKFVDYGTILLSSEQLELETCISRL